MRAVTNFFLVKSATRYPQIAWVSWVPADSSVLTYLLLVLRGRIEMTAQCAACVIVWYGPDGDIITVLIPTSLKITSMHFLLMDAALAPLPEFLLAAVYAAYEGLLARVRVLVLREVLLE